MSHIFSFGTSAVSLDQSSAQKFFQMLTHDDRSSFYCIAQRNAAGVWNESFVSAQKLVGYSLFDDTSDWYVSRNGFTQRSRKAERLRQINAFMFDLDCHGAGEAVGAEGGAVGAAGVAGTSREVSAAGAVGAAGAVRAGASEARAAVAQGLRALERAVQRCVLPEPTMVVDTGRGLHIYYVLDHSLSYRLKGSHFNEKGISFFRAVEKKLLGALRFALSGVPALEPDTAVFDFSRVGRIPGTYNVSAGCFSRLVHCSEQFYGLAQLSQACDVAARSYASDSPAFGEGERLSSSSSMPASHQKTRFVVFDKLSLSRVGKIQKLQEIRGFDCKGNRELMCFCFYNAAVQVYSNKNDAYEQLAQFNGKFHEPLSATVLNEIVRSVGKVGFYKMSAATIVDKLKMSSREIELTAFFESRRMIERQKAKQVTAEKRLARNARILALYALPGETIESVAQAVGVCKRTVASVLKQARTAALNAAGEAAVCALTGAAAGGTGASSAQALTQRVKIDLKTAARKALDALKSRKCNFLADDFISVGTSSFSSTSARLSEPSLPSSFILKTLKDPVWSPSSA